jgi:hypothetical protein
MFIVRVDGDRYQLNLADELGIPVQIPPFLPIEEHADFVRIAIGMAKLGSGKQILGVRMISDIEIHISPEFFDKPDVRGIISGESVEWSSDKSSDYDNWGNW